MANQKWKTIVTGGIYQDNSINKWWHYYLGAAISGNFHTREQAEKVLIAQFDQAKQQFGEKWEVTIKRKDL